MSIDLSVVVPVYNEEKNIKPFLARLLPVLNRTVKKYEIIFCMDPSIDETEIKIKKEIQNNNNIKLLIFSRKFGQPAATMAGILNCEGKYCVVIDVDLQDQPELIEKMYKKSLKDFDVVYAKRTSRKGETVLKKIISWLGYRIINKLSDVKIPENTGDFRIISRKIIEHLRELNETHGFLRGLVSFVGFKQGFVEYDRDPRIHGKGNYNKYTGSFKIGINGLVSFSSKPLYLMSIIGFLFSLFSFFLGAMTLLQKIIGIQLPIGVPTTIIMISFFSGLQLLGLGIIGEYIGRIYDEVKRRPMYIIDKKVNFKNNNN